MLLHMDIKLCVKAFSNRHPIFTSSTREAHLTNRRSRGMKPALPRTCQQMKLHVHQHAPSLLRRSVSWLWWTPPVEPCHCPWGQRPDTSFLNNPPAFRKGTSWCRHRKSIPGTRRNPSKHPAAAAWELCGCRGHWLWKRTLRKRKRMKRPWGWRACPCRQWGGWRAGRARSTCPHCHCHGHYHGHTWPGGGEKKKTKTKKQHSVTLLLLLSNNNNNSVSWLISHFYCWVRARDMLDFTIPFSNDSLMTKISTHTQNDKINTAWCLSPCMHYVTTIELTCLWVNFCSFTSCTLSWSGEKRWALSGSKLFTSS